MPIRVSTVTVNFKDEAGKPVSDASFTLRTRLSHEAQMDYLETAASYKVDPESGELQVEAAKPQLKKMTDIMVRDALVEWTGVEDRHGQPIPIDRYTEADALVIDQVVGEIRDRNKQSKEDAPKDAAPSATS